MLNYVKLFFLMPAQVTEIANTEVIASSGFKRIPLRVENISRFNPGS